ncbi:hypothetical protein SCP_0804230 [Sparassis crispa]|uniref:Uncharacterized protein n=1 Tax=Sparassis crispa TaxID=139825 RepID=A0A401GUN4_9APHY|nr:hypothetical protein SCP_0804230 [Sparassis crispa]GBE85899.1 hypothetical protein SCP_0804230 [Sparassis crispa]
MRYRTTFAALVALAQPLAKVGWQSELRPLNTTDVRGMTELLAQESEGRRTLAWIWMAPGAGEGSAGDTQDSLRIEWCKARARAHRWTEECQLLEEEMHCVLEFQEWIASWWLDQVEGTVARLPEHEEGCIVYAYRQAEIRRAMSSICERAWKDVPEWLKIEDDVD